MHQAADELEHERVDDDREAARPSAHREVAVVVVDAALLGQVVEVGLGLREHLQRLALPVLLPRRRRPRSSTTGASSDP